MLGKIERVENLVQLASNELLTRDHKNLLYGITFGINQKFPDKEELSAKLLGMGVGRHTWFGSERTSKGTSYLGVRALAEGNAGSCTRTR